jgi:hypothetical protein
VALVRGPRRARAPVAVEAHRVQPAVGQPEALEPHLHVGRLALQRGRPRLVAIGGEQPREPALGAHHVALRLHEGDRRLERQPVLVDHAVVGVLPALVAQAAGSALAVVQEPVPVVVAVAVHPAQRGLHRVAELVEQVERAAPVRVLGHQAQEQRGGVHRPVVARERRERPGGDLAGAQLVQHLPRLLLVDGVHAAAQAGGQQPQRARGHAVVEGEHLERGDEAVAPEERAEPRDAGGVELVPVELRAQHPQVEQRPAQDAVEQLIVGGHASALRQPFVDREAHGARRVGRGGIARRHVVLVHLVGQQQVLVAAGRERERESQAADADQLGLGHRRHRRRTPDAVPAARGEAQPAPDRLDLHLGRDRARRHAAQREHRHEVRVEQDLDVELEPLAAVLVDVDALAQPPRLGQRAVDADLQGLQREQPAVRRPQLRVRQLVHALGARGRRGHEQSRLHTRDPQLVTRQEAAVVEVEAQRMAALDRDRPVARGDQEGVRLLQHDGVGEVDGAAGGGVGDGPPGRDVRLGRGHACRA